jgi:hypothetical protein
MPGGFATVTFANNPICVNYVGTGVQFALNLPFVPSAVEFNSASLSWTWYRGMIFGDAIVATGTRSVSANNLAGVLDVLDGSGVASTNVGTTTAIMGLLIGTNTIVNNGSGQMYFGKIYR